MSFYNKNLTSLKCVLFLFFGALGSLLPFLPIHMNHLGLSRDESTIISIVAPLIAIFGPLIAAPLADRLAGGFSGASRSKTGRYLRVMIALCLILATIFYWLLITIPPIFRSPPNVTFMCDPNGGFILQDRCGAERTCSQWSGERGSVLVKNCIFTCKATTTYKAHPALPPEEFSGSNDEVSTEEYPYDDYNSNSTIAPEVEYYRSGYPSNAQPYVNDRPIDVGLIPMPHMCFKNHTDGETICEVYSNGTEAIHFDLSLKSPSVQNATSAESSEEEDICRYPFNDYFHCRITQRTEDELTALNPNCKPLVLCEIHDPYNNTNSLLKKSQCGYNNISFWLYLVIRSIADIFPATAVALLSTAVVIATRETSTGRGDVGKQFAAGALGFAIFAPIIGGPANGAFLEAMICFTVLMALAVLILIFDNNMPLSPPEWWWHTRCGLLALPMSSVRKYGVEIIALAFILFVLGIFWNAIDTFLPWHVVKLSEGTPLIIGLTITIGSLPAVIFLMYAERIIDYCNHPNIFIICFVCYIIHHVGLLLTEEAAVLLIFEIFEIFSLHMMWVTAILYLRHLVPRKFTACGQALPVITHFCIGRCIGAWLGSLAYTEYPYNFNSVHEGFAIAAAVCAALSFLVYHLYLKPKCVAPTQLPPYPAPSVVQSANGNGSYTPLRVYHNSRAKKGHFRY